MATLEDDIERLTELDQLRVLAARLRDEGRNALSRSFDRKRDPHEKWEPADPRHDVIEKAVVLKALLAHRINPVKIPPRLLQDLESLTLTQVMDPEPDGVPVLRAARAMCGLVAARDSAFSRSVIYLYYSVVKEIHASDAPDWISGGARAGEDSSPNAFVTLQCIRAILGFQNALQHTATYIAGLAVVFEQRENRSTRPLLRAWSDVEDKRLAFDFLIAIESLMGNLALRMPALLPRDGEGMPPLDSRRIDRFLSSIRGTLRKEIKRCHREFKTALRDIDRHRATLERTEDRLDQMRLKRSRTAHEVARAAVADALDRASLALQIFKGNKHPAAELRELERMFRSVAIETANILRPAVEYVSRVLDRELAAASNSRADVPACDAAELAFAAVAFGQATQRWRDERLRRAGEHLARTIGERGRFPLGRPIRASSRGYGLHVLNAEVIRAFAKVLQHVDAIELDAGIVKRMMGFFRDMQVPSRLGAWHHEEVRGRQLPRRFIAGTAVMALDDINEMLDHRINGIVCRHFSDKKPEDITAPALPNLFYGDYGLVSADPGTKVRRAESVAVVLERLRAHVCGIPARRLGARPIFSLILHGPPGTGKTTLVEALARSCNVRLIEVTPTDIVIGGPDNIERRTRAVFKALSLLTRAVILFDEFDPVLLERNPTERNPSVFSFLTPGMLPKLKTLHDSAARRSVAYVLITNFIGKLDDAAIRDGRFDVRLGIYPPDLLSRAGGLYKAIAAYTRRTTNGRRRVHEPREAVVFEVLRDTAGGGMNKLGRPGWFSPPVDGNDSEANAFARLYGRLDQLERVEPDAKLAMHSRKAIAEQEFREWAWIQMWDEAARDKSCRRLATALKQQPSCEVLDARLQKEKSKPGDRLGAFRYVMQRERSTAVGR